MSKFKGLEFVVKENPAILTNVLAQILLYVIRKLKATYLLLCEERISGGVEETKVCLLEELSSFVDDNPPFDSAGVSFPADSFSKNLTNNSDNDYCLKRK